MIDDLERTQIAAGTGFIRRHYLEAGCQPSGMPTGDVFAGGGIDNNPGVTKRTRYLFQRAWRVVCQIFRYETWVQTQKIANAVTRVADLHEPEVFCLLRLLQTRKAG